MFENVFNFLKKIGKKERIEEKSKDTAKERLHLVLMQDRANVSADFLDLMRQEIIEVIKKYIDVDDKDIDVRLTNKTNEDGTVGAPALYANIPIAGIKEEVKIDKKETNDKKKIEEKISEDNSEKEQEKAEKEVNNETAGKVLVEADEKSNEDLKEEKDINKKEDTENNKENNNQESDNKDNQDSDNGEKNKNSKDDKDNLSIQKSANNPDKKNSQNGSKNKNSQNNQNKNQKKKTNKK